MTISTVVVNAGTRCISGKPRFFKAIENIGRTPHEECNDLVAANSILDQLDTRSPLRSGLMNVSISDIVGSVGRFQDFRLDFSPRHDFSADRIRYFINMIERRDRLPPVLLYKVGSALFVVDGHHRIGAARVIGREIISAHVVEFEPAQLIPDSSCKRLGYKSRLMHLRQDEQTSGKIL